MIRIPMKVDYGVRALVELAYHYGQGPVPTSLIAARQGIPEPYLDQLLTTLHKFGLIRSRRGPQGGHTLAKPPGEISLAMVVKIFEGTSSMLLCFDEPLECSVYNSCTQREVWQSLGEAVQNVLHSTTIGDLVEQQKQLEKVTRS